MPPLCFAFLAMGHLVPAGARPQESPLKKALLVLFWHGACAGAARGKGAKARVGTAR